MPALRVLKSIPGKLVHGRFVANPKTKLKRVPAGIRVHSVRKNRDGTIDVIVVQKGRKR